MDNKSELIKLMHDIYNAITDPINEYHNIFISASTCDKFHQIMIPCQIGKIYDITARYVNYRIQFVDVSPFTTTLVDYIQIPVIRFYYEEIKTSLMYTHALESAFISGVYPFITEFKKILMAIEDRTGIPLPPIWWDKVHDIENKPYRNIRLL